MYIRNVNEICSSCGARPGSSCVHSALSSASRAAAAVTVTRDDRARSLEERRVKAFESMAHSFEVIADVFHLG